MKLSRVPTSSRKKKGCNELGGDGARALWEFVSMHGDAEAAARFFDFPIEKLRARIRDMREKMNRGSESLGELRKKRSRRIRGQTAPVRNGSRRRKAYLFGWCW